MTILYIFLTIYAGVGLGAALTEFFSNKSQLMETFQESIPVEIKGYREFKINPNHEDTHGNS